MEVDERVFWIRIVTPRRCFKTDGEACPLLLGGRRTGGVFDPVGDGHEGR